MGVHCCAGFSLVSESRGLLFIAVQGLLTAVASPVEPGVYEAWASIVAARGLSGCGSQAPELRPSSWGTRT